MTPAWYLLALAIAMIAVHLLCYVVAFRNVGSFRKESVIFSYHLASFILLLVIAAGFFARAPYEEVLISAVGALALHGIYSMSFLELWSLSQISYSVAMLAAIEAEPNLDIPGVKAAFSHTGQDKKTARLAALEKLSLVRLSGTQVFLTSRAKPIAKGLAVVRWIANLRATG